MFQFPALVLLFWTKHFFHLLFEIEWTKVRTASCLRHFGFPKTTAEIENLPCCWIRRRFIDLILVPCDFGSFDWVEHLKKFEEFELHCVLRPKAFSLVRSRSPSFFNNLPSASSSWNSYLNLLFPFPAGLTESLLANSKYLSISHATPSILGDSQRTTPSPAPY